MQRYVALKITMSETQSHSRELRVLRLLSSSSSTHPGSQHVVQLLDDFQHAGPNGTHTCLVFEVLGPNVLTVFDAHCPHGRLPGKVAKRVCKQALLGLDFLHQHQVGHGGALRSTIARLFPVSSTADTGQICTQAISPSPYPV